ncbi:hypothetical protein HTY54_28995 [Escherichia coli]|nr:hypothetical protein [Escherichia coli]
MMDVKEKVLQVMRSQAALQDKALGGKYPFRMATSESAVGNGEGISLMKNGVRQICAKFLWRWLKMEQYPKIPMPAGLVRRYGDWR